MANLAERIMQLRPVDRPDGAPWDRGWYDGITASAAVARQGTSEPDPLRELAVWLADMGDPAAIEAPRAALVQIKARARAVLGKEG